jgi:Zn-finger nucleic acid-binding protein
MKEVTAPAEPGALIQLDQCGKCGGIWCDKWELFPIDPDAAHMIDALDGALLVARAAGPAKQLYCPRCTAPLLECQDPLLPPDLLFDRCLRCEGVWLNRHEMARYKEHQRKIRAKKLGSASIAQKLTDVYGNPQAWVVKGTGGMMAYPRNGLEPVADAKPATAAVFATILQALVRAALGV